MPSCVPGVRAADQRGAPHPEHIRSYRIQQRRDWASRQRRGRPGRAAPRLSPAIPSRPAAPANCQRSTLSALGAGARSRIPFIDRVPAFICPSCTRLERGTHRPAARIRHVARCSANESDCSQGMATREAADVLCPFKAHGMWLVSLYSGRCPGLACRGPFGANGHPAPCSQAIVAAGRQPSGGEPNAHTLGLVRSHVTVAAGRQASGGTANTRTLGVARSHVIVAAGRQPSGCGPNAHTLGVARSHGTVAAGRQPSGCGPNMHTQRRLAPTSAERQARLSERPASYALETPYQWPCATALRRRTAS
jgi:hypothetical protein